MREQRGAEWARMEPRGAEWARMEPRDPTGRSEAERKRRGGVRRVRAARRLAVSELAPSERRSQ